ncbi:14206_t:CDS:2, partial [Cetraspora pellucida]
KEKTSVLDTKVENISHLPKSEPSNSNNKNENSWASNIEQEEKLISKGKQKAIPLTREVNKAKSDKTCDKQVELKIEKMKAFQDPKVNKTDMSKDTTNITTNNTSEKQVTLDNTAEIEDTTRQELDKTTNEHS